MNELVKAEILWTRDCPLSCKYCAMKRSPGKIKKNLDLWKRGFTNLHNLGCHFAAFYGAEPLVDYDYLPDIIQYLENIGMLNTIITSCVLSDTKEKLIDLYKHGLRSLTVSFDGFENENQDKSSKAKSINGYELAKWWKETFKNYRDVALVATATKQNLHKFPSWIEKFSEDNFWFFFDIIHKDEGQPGTKCRNYEGIEDLLFSRKDVNLIRKVFKTLKKMKKNGYRIHQSYSFLNQVITDPYFIINKQWLCTDECLNGKDVFPSWVTINNDGVTYICDDFQPEIPENDKVYFWNLIPSIWKDFKQYWKMQVKKYKCSCCWNTHWDANMIKGGIESFGDYVDEEKIS